MNHPMLRVALIQTRNPGAHRLGQSAAMPLGLLSLAAYVREKLPDRTVFELADTYFLSDVEIDAWLARFRPDLVAISGLTVFATRIRDLAGLASRRLGRDVPVVVGGPHATDYPDEVLGYDGVWAVVHGEGEIPFTDLVEYRLGLRSADSLRGVTRRGDQATATRAAERIAGLDTLPMPAFDLIDLNLYERAPSPLATIVLPPHRYVAMHSSRGCPYGCTFCHGIFGRRFRAQSVTRVVDEMDHLAGRYGVTNFHFYDDIFNATPRRLPEFCHEIVRRGRRWKLYFDNGLRTDTLNRPTLEGMREAGVVYFGAAFEATSPRAQGIIQKKLDVEKALENVAIADEVGIFTTGFLMLGVPGETHDDLQMTIRTAEQSRLHYAYFSVTNPYQGTPLGATLLASGHDVSSSQMVGYSSPGKNFAGFDEEEFRRIVRSAYRRFWTPARFASFLSRHPDPDTLWLALASPASRKGLMRRVGSVLGLPPGDLREESWAAPADLAPGVVQAAQVAGSMTRRLASLLVGPARLRPRSPT